MPRINQTTNPVVIPGDVEIHNLTILDRSGSMGGAKWNAAVKGVKLDYENCKKEGFKSYTFIQFDYPGSDIVQVLNFGKEELKFAYANGMTALYDAVGNALTNAFKTLTGKVLVKIFTDGGENASIKFKANQVRDLIKEAETKGYTITFVGTEHDVLDIQDKFQIDATNTISHNNTGEGVAMIFNTYAEATSEYTKNIKQGKSVTRGFFSKTIK